MHTRIHLTHRTPHTHTHTRTYIHLLDSTDFVMLFLQVSYGCEQDFRTTWEVLGFARGEIELEVQGRA